MSLDCFVEYQYKHIYIVYECVNRRETDVLECLKKNRFLLIKSSLMNVYNIGLFSLDTWKNRENDCP